MRLCIYRGNPQSILAAAVVAGKYPDVKFIEWSSNCIPAAKLPTVSSGDEVWMFNAIVPSGYLLAMNSVATLNIYTDDNSFWTNLYGQLKTSGLNWTIGKQEEIAGLVWRKLCPDTDMPEIIDTAVVDGALVSNYLIAFGINSPALLAAKLNDMTKTMAITCGNIIASYLANKSSFVG
jgi:hypothetical protein